MPLPVSGARQGSAPGVPSAKIQVAAASARKWTGDFMVESSHDVENLGMGLPAGRQPGAHSHVKSVAPEGGAMPSPGAVEWD